MNKDLRDQEISSRDSYSIDSSNEDQDLESVVSNISESPKRLIIDEENTIVISKPMNVNSNHNGTLTDIEKAKEKENVSHKRKRNDEDDKNENGFVCKWPECQLILQDPILLPCKSTICSIHWQKNPFYCLICKQEHEGYIENEALKNIIAEGFHLSPRRKKILKSLKDSNNLMSEFQIETNRMMFTLSRKPTLKPDELKNLSENWMKFLGKLQEDLSSLLVEHIQSEARARN